MWVPSHTRLCGGPTLAKAWQNLLRCATERGRMTFPTSVLSTCVTSRTSLARSGHARLGYHEVAFFCVGRDHRRKRAKLRLLSFRWRAGMNVSELENQKDDIPQAASECADARNGSSQNVFGVSDLRTHEHAVPRRRMTSFRHRSLVGRYPGDDRSASQWGLLLQDRQSLHHSRSRTTMRTFVSRRELIPTRIVRMSDG